MRIAIVGSGVAGLACAHVLGTHHDVTLFEASSRLGGHVNTVTVDDPVAGALQVDTGFIVHNDRNYPNFSRLLTELGVQTQNAEMSFGVTDRDYDGAGTPFSYRASNLATLFADRRNLTRPTMWRMLVDIVRFNRAAKRLLDTHETDPSTVDETTSLADFLAAGRFSPAFVDLHLLPLGAAVWSADPAKFDAFPVSTLLGFLRNHGLLDFRDRPQWRTIVGGSGTYVDAIVARFPGRIRVDTPVLGVARDENGVRIRTADTSERFDRVIIACHSDQALRILDDATVAEKETLDAIDYQANVATLHTDTSVLSPFRGAWSAWNCERARPGVDPAGVATLTYDMTLLQHLPGSRRYLVSLNSGHRIDPDSVIASFDYTHPVFDGRAIAAQERFDEINAAGPVQFCGAYWGHGFHEDGITSALRVCKQIGVIW